MKQLGTEADIDECVDSTRINRYEKGSQQADEATFFLLLQVLVIRWLVFMPKVAFMLN